MTKLIYVAVFSFLLLEVARASNTCMVTMVSGSGESNGISVTFRNAGKLPIRRLELDCSPNHAHSHKATVALCDVENGLFFPGIEYTASYPYPAGTARWLMVSLRSATLSDGYIWKPAESQHCRVLKIYARMPLAK